MSGIALQNLHNYSVLLEDLLTYSGLDVDLNLNALADGMREIPESK